MEKRALNVCIIPGTASPSNVTSETSKQLAFVSVKYVTKVSSIVVPSRFAADGGPHATSLRCSIDELMVTYESHFKNMCNKLKIDDTNCCETLTNVVRHMFKDKNCNWGRIVTVYGFAGYLAKHCVENGLPADVPARIADATGVYVASELGEWIDKQGGWSSFSGECSPTDARDASMWHTLVMAGVGVLNNFIQVR